jgi:hypothetical protein
MMRLIGPHIAVLALAAATAANAQPIPFSYAGQSSDQGVSVFADGQLALTALGQDRSKLSLTVSNVHSDFGGNNPALRMFASALIAPDSAVVTGLDIFDTTTGTSRSDLVFGISKDLKGEMIDVDGTSVSIDDTFPDGFDLGFKGRRGGDGVRIGESVTFDYEVTGVAIGVLDDFYRSFDGYFAIARFRSVGAGGDDSAKVPGGGGTSNLVNTPLPGTTGMAVSGICVLGASTRRRRGH